MHIILVTGTIYPWHLDILTFFVILGCSLFMASKLLPGLGLITNQLLKEILFNAWPRINQKLVAKEMHLFLCILCWLQAALAHCMSTF